MQQSLPGRRPCSHTSAARARKTARVPQLYSYCPRAVIWHRICLSQGMRLAEPARRAASGPPRKPPYEFFMITVLITSPACAHLSQHFSMILTRLSHTIT